MPSLQASLRNLQKAKANWRRPRRFRSVQESQVIRRLVWQWLSYRGPKWSGRTVGRRLGVSHTYIQKLAREFAGKMERMVKNPTATFDELSRAQQETLRQEERGYLRESRRWKYSESLRAPQDVPVWAMPCRSMEQPREFRSAGDGGWMY